MLSQGTVVRTVGLREIQLKLEAAQPAILARNRLLVTSMLEFVKAGEEAAVPFGPAHFGYHGRDTVRIEVKSAGRETTGKLLGAAQLFWREYGTGSHGRRHGKVRLSAREAATAGAMIGGGERAFMTAHKAYSQSRAIIRLFYGNMKTWWLSAG